MGTTVGNGYAEYTSVRASGLVRIPAELSALDAAPLLCAGLTVYRALSQVQARPGALVVVHGIGGLGHLGIQYASRLGYRVAAIARGTGKAELAATRDGGLHRQRRGGPRHSADQARRCRRADRDRHHRRVDDTPGQGAGAARAPDRARGHVTRCRSRPSR